MLRVRLIVALFMIPLGAAASSVACIPLSKPSGTGGAGGSGSSTTTAAATTGTGAKGCDAQATCDDCKQCAAQGVCSVQVTVCNQDSVCSGLDQCIGLCGNDSDCKTQCINQNQAGLDLYNSAYACVYCTACPTACKGFATCK